MQKMKDDENAITGSRIRKMMLIALPTIAATQSQADMHNQSMEIS